MTDGIQDTTTNLVRLQEAGAGSQVDANGFLIDATGAQILDGAGNRIMLSQDANGVVTRLAYDALGNQVAYTPRAEAANTQVAATTTVPATAATTVVPAAATVSTVPVTATVTTAPVATATGTATVAPTTGCVNTQYSDGNIYCV